MKPIDIYTDGSSRANGKPECTGGWSMCIPDFNGQRYVRYGFLGAPSSNNKAEIMGVLIAVRLFHRQSLFAPTIYSDSKYVVESCNTWRKGWINKQTGGYREGIKNQQILVPLFEMLDSSQCPITLKWVKGHAGIPGNELADEFAGYGNDRIDRSVKSDNRDVEYLTQEQLIQRFGYETRYQ